MAVLPGRAKLALDRETSSMIFDDVCDLLGRANWADLIQLRHESGDVEALVGDGFSSPDQFLFSDVLDSRFSLEVLWLKWNLFADLCRELHRFHEKNKRPHLHLRPDNLHFNMPPTHFTSVPLRWLFTTSLLDVGLEAAKYELESPMPPDLALRIFNPPNDSESGYDAAVMFEKKLGDEVKGTALLRAIDPLREEKMEEETGKGMRGIIELHFLSEEILSSEFSENDVFLVELHFEAEDTAKLRVWASMKSPLEKGILLRGLSEPVTPDIWQMLLAAQRSIFSQSTMKIFKSFHAPCDLYSLGMMLFRLLLVNDRQDFQIVRQSVLHLAKGLAPMVEGLRHEDHPILLKRFKDRLSEYGLVFSKQSVLHTSSIAADTSISISDELWADSLIFAFKLITNIPGFSFARNHGDVQIEQPEQLMARVLQSLASLQTQCKMALFGSEARDREIVAVCKEMMTAASLNEEMAKNAL